MSAAMTIALLLLVAALAIVLAFRWRHVRFQKACTAAFDEAFVGLSPPPVLKMTYVYSFPAFTVTFASPSQLNAAKEQGQLKRFNAAIQSLCKDKGSPERPFSAEQATYYSCLRQQ